FSSTAGASNPKGCWQARQTTGWKKAMTCCCRTADSTGSNPKAGHVTERAEINHIPEEMTESRSRIIVAVLLLAAAATACNRGIQYSENYRIEEGRWNMHDPAKYSCTVDDTVMTYDI